MKYGIGGTAIATALVLAVAAGAQYPYPPGAPPPPTAAVQALYIAPQLDQMLASIALYPDPLLTAMLTAATYPLEIVDADRWLAVPYNASLRGGSLAAALQSQNWDPSVKTLVPFPAILRMMDEHLDWTQAIGNAFLAQPAEVMDSIQRLRHQALAAGTLVSSPAQSVIINGPYIQIEPANQQVVAIPVYNPTVVYGPWPYPAYLPIYFGPPPGLQFGIAYGNIRFSIGIGIIGVLWNWGQWDWRDHDIRIDRDRFNRINAGHPPITANVWQHAPEHRRGVPYRDLRSQQRYQPVPGTPAQRREYRGYATPPAQGQARPGAPAPAQPPRRETPPPRREAPPPRGEAARPAAPRPAVPRPEAPRPVVPRPEAPRPAAPRPAVPQQQRPVQRPQPQRAAPTVPPAAQRPTPQGPGTAFQGFTGSREAQQAAQRGRESRAATPQRQAPAPQARPAPPRAAPQAPRPQARPAAPAPRPQPRGEGARPGERRP